MKPVLSTLFVLRPSMRFLVLIAYRIIVLIAVFHATSNSIQFSMKLIFLYKSLICCYHRRLSFPHSPPIPAFLPMIPNFHHLTNHRRMKWTSGFLSYFCMTSVRPSFCVFNICRLVTLTIFFGSLGITFLRYSHLDQLFVLPICGGDCGKLSYTIIGTFPFLS